LRNELPYFYNVLCRAGMEMESPTRDSLGRSPLEQFFLTLPQAFEEGLAVDRLDATALDVVVSAIEHFARLGEFLQISSHRVFDQVVGSTSGFRGEFLQAGFGFGTEMDFHEVSLHGC
jgi:hypothetical protein